MIRDADAPARKQRFLVSRYALILVTGVVGYLQGAHQGSPMPITIVMAIAAVSTLSLDTISAFSFFDATMQAPILIPDTAMVSAVLMISRANQEFFLFFFFVLIMAAKIENLTVLGVTAALIGVASLLFTDLKDGWLSPILMRV